MDLKGILKGWANVVKDEFGLLSPELQQLSETRLKICDNCTVRDNNSCSRRRQTTHVDTGEMVYGCGCNIAAKTTLPEKECPAGKWKKQS